MVPTPRRVRIRRLLIGGALVLATAVATAAERTPSPTTASGSPGVAASPRFRISGHVTDLYPGARTRMRLALRNPNPYAIRVTRIRTSVKVPARSSCPARSIKVTRFTGSRRIAPRAAVRVKVNVSMRAKVPNTCAGQRYRLTYRGWATRA
jgi:hypothetical protein